MDLLTISAILYLVSATLSIVFALLIINKLYISKKFTKKRDFHFYNDLFSWEMFYFFIGTENLIQILSLIMAINNETLDFLLRIRILILYFPFWNKIIHLEKVMDKITYERHYFAGIIPLIMALFLGFTNLPNFILIFVFFGTSLIPFLFFFIFLKNSNATKKKTVKIILGAIFIGLVGIIRPDTTDLLANITNITAPVSLIIGVLLIFDSFRKNIK
ncbi:MAG: hypothetical protein ACW98D_00790 [Promethearchaeota archaeon]|jgi:hypothetical protein